MTDQDKITALRDALTAVRHSLQLINDTPGGAITDTLWMMDQPETIFDHIDTALAMTADASEGATDSAPKFDDAAFDAMVERGTKVWSTVPDDWLEEHRGNLDSEVKL